jgi:hypothetical protein
MIVPVLSTKRSLAAAYIRRQLGNAPPLESGWLIFRIWLTGLLLVLGSLVTMVEFIRGHYLAMGFSVIVAIAGLVLLKQGMTHANRGVDDAQNNPAPVDAAPPPDDLRHSVDHTR